MATRLPLVIVSKVVLTLQNEARRQGLTSYRLAKVTGLRIHTLQRLLAGDGSPTIFTLEAVATALGMTIDASPCCTHLAEHSLGIQLEADADLHLNPKYKSPSKSASKIVRKNSLRSVVKK